MSDWMADSLLHGTYFYMIALVLAILEIQIEGKDGWAGNLPTWKWDSPIILRLIGRPVTGYHVFMNVFILLFIHLPLVYSGFSLAQESELLGFYFLICVFWDFLWFVCNPHYGLARFQRKHVGWYKAWFLGAPVDYFVGLLVSFAIFMAPALPEARIAWAGRALQWSVILGQFLVFTALATLVASRAARRPAVKVESGVSKAD